MSLQAGQTLLHYRIEAPIGKGGMGEVYRARDTRLGRDVALKLLPAELRADPQRLARLEREARLLAALNHPHVATLHGLEESGDGIRFLVMELVEGETLGGRLEQGALPLEKIYGWGAQIAGALDAAHQRGIIHRDLKPGNIMLTRAGIKLLDFGLAKAVDPLPLGSQHPTETLATRTPGDRSAHLTGEGGIVGTFQYMSPEQLEGREADTRTDVFALGAVLYEMATGQRAFQGRSKASLIAAILTSEPPSIVRRQPLAPPALERLVRVCLAKDPEDRWQSVRDLQRELIWLGAPRANASGGTDPSRTAGRRTRSGLSWAIAAVALIASLGLAVFQLWQPAPARLQVTRFTISLPEGTTSGLARVSPDGKWISIPAQTGGLRQIWLRPLDGTSVQPLLGTQGVRAHFWSPDSRSIGFIAEGQLKKVDVKGGLPEILCEAPGAGPSQFGAWGRGGTILFGVAEAPDLESGLYRVAASGGKPSRVTLTGDSAADWELAWPFWPHFLPDGRRFVHMCRPPGDDSRDSLGICLTDLEAGETQRLVGIPSYAEYAPPGYLLYARGGVLLAHPFDLDRLALDDEPRPIVDGLENWQGLGLPTFSSSTNGVLVHETGAAESRLVWRNRAGAELGHVGSPAHYLDLALAPDGRRLATTIGDPQTGENDIWIMELARGVATRLTQEGGWAGSPLWSPDGHRMIYAAARDNPPSMFLRPIGGGEERELLPSRGTMQWASAWSPDGRSILYSDRDPSSGWDLWALSLDGDGNPTPLARTRYGEGSGVFSPDGLWISYESNETGRPEVYVQPFQAPGEKRRVSTAGGTGPRWPREGRELFYISPDDHLMAVPITSGASLELGTPTPLFRIPAVPDGFISYEVTPDGQRFLVIEPLHEAVAGPMVVVNWTADLP